MLINVIFLAKIVINNHFRIVSNKIQSYHNFFLTFSRAGLVLVLRADFNSACCITPVYLY